MTIKPQKRAWILHGTHVLDEGIASEVEYPQTTP